MGKKKEGPYQIFIKDEFNKMKRQGIHVEFNSLYAKLGPKWQSLSEEQKAHYKQRSSEGNSDGQSNAPPVSKAPPATPQRPPETKPIVNDFSFNSSRDSNSDTKVNLERKFAPNSKEDLDEKPVIKEERGIKRQLEVDIVPEVRKDEQQHGQPKKKWKEACGVGKGFPNLKNIKTAPESDSERYFDHHLFVLRNTCQEIVSTRADKCLKVPLYTFSCNILCKYKKDGKDVKYIPLEIGINAHSIKSGQVKEPYHVIIDSGPPPKNYWGDTYDHLISTHKIQLTQSGVYPAEARKDYKTIYREIMKYIHDSERTILVADNHDLEQVKMSIEWLYEMAEAEVQSQALAQGSVQAPKLVKPSSLTILPLVDFVAAIYNHIYVRMLHYPLPKFTLHYYLKVRLETSIWDYDLDLMCSYHKKDANQTKWCARSCAVRATNALLLTFEEIYKNFMLAAELKQKEIDKLRQQREQQRPQYQQQEQQQQQQQQQQQRHQQQIAERDLIIVERSKATRIPIQQVQQPLHMPEEKQPPPLIEEIARREEMRKQQQEQHQKMIQLSHAPHNN